MNDFTYYYPDDRMISLIKDDYRMIQVMSRFGIPMGFGDKTIAMVCEDCKVDCETFLAIVNFLSNDFNASIDVKKLSLKSLLHYLKQSHIYFLEYCLPSIRRKLLDGIILRNSDVSFLIIRMFDEYVSAVRAHMEQEEKTLFTHIRVLLEGEKRTGTDIAVYSDSHDLVESKLKEVKNIIIKYSPADANINLLNDALFDLYKCEEELQGHCRIEDYLLIPALKELNRI